MLLNLQIICLRGIKVLLWMKKFTPDEYKASQKLVCNNIKDGNVAFTVVEAEMYIIYEALHTKAPLLVRSKKKYVLISRSVYWVLLVTTLGVFGVFAFMDKGGFCSVDVAVTYGLLFGTVILDAIAVLIMIFSSYLVVASMLQSPILGILVRRPSELVMRLWSRCFPQTMHQYNLISHCRQQRSRSCQNLLSFFGRAGFWDELKSAWVPIPQAERLQRRIFSKAKPVFDLPRRKTGGQLCPKDHWAYHFPYPTESSHKLFYATSDEEFLILSHIATEICFHFDDAHSKEMILNSLKSNHVKDFRVWCKLMSDYVLYLAAFKPSCMETASKYQKTIEETLAEVAELFLPGNKKSLTDQRKACEEILGLAKTNNITNDSMKDDDDELVLDESGKGNRSKGSILYRASLLANVSISSQDAYTRRGRLFDVWMERLLEAAKWSKPNFQAQNLCKGGEFLSLV